MVLNIKVSHEYTPRVKSRITALTVITVALVAVLGVVVVRLAREVGERETSGIDKRVLLDIHSHSTPFLNSLMLHTTNLGSPLFLAIAAFLLGLYFAYKKQVKNFLIVGGGMVGAAGLAFVIKSVVERPRPHLWHHAIAHDTGFSFISGHATMSMAFVAVIIAIVWHTKWRYPAIIGGGLYVLYIGFSRLYLGLHYPTDIIGGWIVAFAWVLVVVLTLRLLFEDTPYVFRKKH